MYCTAYATVCVCVCLFIYLRMALASVCATPAVEQLHILISVDLVALAV